MQLIQRKTLLYQEGRSDKVYEVDLCQVGENRYVVNFRYGKRGGTLKEGVETVSAIALTEAQRVFDRLIQSKIQKGYQEVTGLAEIEATPTATTAPAIAPVVAPKDDNARIQGILTRLATEVNDLQVGAARRSPISRKPWPLTRVIWRAGELKIQAAVPLLIQLIRNDALTNYCIAWSLGQLGQVGDASTYSTLEQLYRHPANPEFVRRISLEAMLKIGDESQRVALQTELLNGLPEELRSLAQSGSAEQFTVALRDYLNMSSYQAFQVIDTLYHINNDTVRPALLELARVAPLSPNYFKQLRHLFKMAEYRQDSEMFGILAYRFEQGEAMYSSDQSYLYFPNGSTMGRFTWNYNPRTRQHERLENPEFQQELLRPDPQIAFSSNTRAYLLRRVWRSLKTLGDLGDPAYVQMAVGVLLEYSDADAEETRESIHYAWDSRSSRIFWDTYAGYLTFGHILYENSSRYVLKRTSRAWRCQGRYKPGDPEPTTREEAFPHLWQQHPEALLKLLVESNCLPIHQFAAKALRTCTAFCSELPVETLILLLNRPYEATARLGFELAQARYQPQNPNEELILAIANCAYAPARSEVYRWISDLGDRAFESPTLISSLAISPQADTRAFVRRLLSTAILADLIARRLVGHLIASLLTLTLDQGAIAHDAAETILVCFALQIRTLGLEIILDLLRHPLAEVQSLGARMLLTHEIQASELPAGLIDALLESRFDEVRVVGVRLLGQLPDEWLIEQSQLLITFVTHELPEMREAIRSAVRRLTTHHPEFAGRLATRLLAIFLEPEPHDGVHNFLAKLLRTDLQNWMAVATPELTQQLLQTESTAAQEIAGCLLQANCDRWSDQFTTAQMAQFTHQEVLAVREAGYRMVRQTVSRLRQTETDLVDAVTILESKWEDAQQFGEELFSRILQPEDLTPALVISICDSNRPAVRKFGRDLVSRCFQIVDGQAYLLKFSEHPATDMQLFATQYLEDFVADNPQRLQELMPYFMRVLAQVNRGRVTKLRVFAFLSAEAIKSEPAARIVAEILTRQSAAIAIGEKARAIETLLKIQKVYPHLSLPIQIKPVEVRHGV